MITFKTHSPPTPPPTDMHFKHEMSENNLTQPHYIPLLSQEFQSMRVSIHTAALKQQQYYNSLLIDEKLHTYLQYKQCLHIGLFSSLIGWS
jgi:hypothetical protein